MHIPPQILAIYPRDMKTVLIIEPDALLREALTITLQGGYKIISLRSIKEALLAITPESIAAVVLGTVASQSEITKLRLRLGLIPFFLLPGLEEFAQSRLEKVVEPLTGEELRSRLRSDISTVLAPTN